jgi:hypothetical protein
LDAIVEASKPNVTHKPCDLEQGSSQAYSLASGAPSVSPSPAALPATVRGVVIASSHRPLCASSTQSRSLSPTGDAVGIPDAQPPSRLFTASTGELVRFQQVDSQWQAVVQGQDRSYPPQRTLSVVSSCDIGTQLAGLQRQDVWASRSRIHIMATSHPPHAPCVYLGKHGLLGGGPTQQVPSAAASANESASTAREQELAPTSHALAPALKTFGEAEWKQYFGDVGSAPDLPSDMAAILDSPCPFWPDQLVKDTHLLVLIPAAVGGVPFTLNWLEELIKYPRNGGHRTEYKYYNERVKAQMGEESPSLSYWLLMTRDVLPGSRRKVYADQKELVAGYATRESVPYALPSVLEAATAILMHHALEGERLFGDHPWTHTRCSEVVDGRDPAVVGSFESSGLCIHYDYCGSNGRDDDGAACCRKF